MDKKLLIRFLNQLLSNHFVMYVKLHRYHWFLKGKHYFQFRGTFKDMYQTFTGDLDNVAERILMIDGKPFATMSKYLDGSTLVEASADDEEEEIIEQLRNDYLQMVKEIKETGIPLAREHKDEPTANLLIDLQSKYEKYIWMLTAYQH